MAHRMQIDNQHGMEGRYSIMSVLGWTGTNSEEIVSAENQALIERSAALEKWLPVRFAVGIVCVMLAVLAAYL